MRKGRILDYDWDHYNAGQVVYQPSQVTPEKLQELYDYAWSSFYSHESQELKMTKLFTRVMRREMEDGTWRPRDRKMMNQSFGKEVKRNIGNI